MSEQATVIAESLPAVVVPPAPKEIEHLSDEERNTWLRTGDVPALPQKEESAPSKPGEAPAKEASAKKAESGTAKKQKPDQERNWRQLETERDTLKAEAEALKKELAASKVKPEEKKSEETKAASLAVTNEPKAPERPKRPRLSDFQTNETYEAAMDKHEEAMLEYPAKKAAFEAAKAENDKRIASLTERQAKVNEAWREIETQGNEIYGKEDWKKIVNLPIYQNDPVELYLRGSEPKIAAHLTQYLGLKTDDLKRIITLPILQQFEELKALETAMREELKLGGTKQEAETKEPPKKEVTAAKKPPSEVGGKAAASGDPIEAALKRGDSDEYQRLMNAQEASRWRAKKGR